MKTKFVLASFIAALGGLAGLVPSAKAGTDFRINLNFGPPPVIVAPTYVAPARPAPRGYWKDVVVKTWVPGRWVFNRDRRGHNVRVFEPGYYAHHTDRVWVESGRDDRDHDYGHGRRRG